MIKRGLIKAAFCRYTFLCKSLTPKLQEEINNLASSHLDISLLRRTQQYYTIYSRSPFTQLKRKHEKANKLVSENKLTNVT